MAQDPQQQAQQKQWSQVVARAWSDESFKQRLLSDPKAVLAEAGLPVPADLHVQVHEATPTHHHLVLPPPLPNSSALSDEQLEEVAGGSTQYTLTVTNNSTQYQDLDVYQKQVDLGVPPR